MICDFCSAPGPTWRYPAHTFIAFEAETDEGDSAGAISVGDWSACDTCHALIEAGDQAAIARRSLDELLMKHTEMIMAADEILVQLCSVHRSFFEQRCGEARPYPEAA